MISHHTEEIASNWFHCDLCNEYYPTVKGLNRHQKSFCRGKKKKVGRKTRKVKKEEEAEESEEEGVEPSDPGSTPLRKLRPRRAAVKRKNYSIDDDYQVTNMNDPALRTKVFKMSG